jgi:adenylylsulfate kinase-like enzyme
VYENPRNADVRIDGTRSAEDNALELLDFLR